MKQVYGLIADCGDGSNCIRWFSSIEKVNEVIDDEDYYSNEGSPLVLTFPDDLDLVACGFNLSS